VLAAPGARAGPPRVAALTGLVGGLAVAPLVAGADPRPPALLGGALAVALALSGRRPGRLTLLAPVALASALLGLGWGIWRVGAIDSGALDLPAEARAAATGHLLDPPRRTGGRVRLRIATADGDLAVEAPEPVPELSPGDAVRATGTIRDPLPWERDRLRRLGVADILVARDVRHLDRRRAGLAGTLDAIRGRAEDALGRGVGTAPASLLRGFVLGQDDRIAEPTVVDFRRSGLAHLLAVSGTNVMLLSVLALAVLGLLGVPLRARLGWALALIAIYVPVAGAGPSIQRAGVMGAAGLVAVLASRPRSRGYALLLAAAATLALNPRACGDVGWQLSFAAVTGILLWTGTLRELLQPPDRDRRSPLRRAAAEGAGLTIAATVATAPLMAHHFDAFSITSLPANLLALPAVAPTMWLGMAAAAVGQAPWLPVEPITALAGGFAAYIGQVAAWTARPEWALIELELASPGAVAGAYALLGGTLTLVLHWWRRRRAHRTRSGVAAVALAVAAVLAALAAPAAIESLVAPAGGAVDPPPGGLLVSVLDVGQGDAILLEPDGAEPVLVDAGPPGAGLAAQLRERGIGRIGALVLTHSDDDHAGGAGEALAAVPVGGLVQASADRGLERAARAAGAGALRVAAGDRVRSGSLRLDVLWPPARLLDPPAPEEANRLSIVMLARFRGFRMLLAGDAEAALAPVDAGSLDVLKVAHHGSEDPGLEALLDRSLPDLAVISAGAGNPYGHPAPPTLAALAAEGIPALRTDVDGEVRIEVARDGWSAAPVP